jgi:hypothetical protein
MAISSWAKDFRSIFVKKIIKARIRITEKDGLFFMTLEFERGYATNKIIMIDIQV